MRPVKWYRRRGRHDIEECDNAVKRKDLNMEKQGVGTLIKIEIAPLKNA